MSSTQPQPRTPNGRRWLLRVVVVLSLLGIAWAAELYRRQRQVERLAREIRNAGGEVILPAAIWDRAWSYLRNPPGLLLWNATGVDLDGVSIDATWLREHDNLKPLKITWLSLGHSPVDGSELVALAREHPVEQFDVWSKSNVDAIAAGFRKSRTLTFAHMTDSDLSDSGLRHLPLEQLIQLEVSGTNVTSAGLQELQRCRVLNLLTIDGKQFNRQVLDLLNSLPHAPMLSLCGGNVTDQHLELLHGTRLPFVGLQQTSASKEAVDALKAASPGCNVSVK